MTDASSIGVNRYTVYAPSDSDLLPASWGRGWAREGLPLRSYAGAAIQHIQASGLATRGRLVLLGSWDLLLAFTLDKQAKTSGKKTRLLHLGSKKKSFTAEQKEKKTRP